MSPHKKSHNPPQTVNISEQLLFLVQHHLRVLRNDLDKEREDRRLEVTALHKEISRLRDQHNSDMTNMDTRLRTFDYGKGPESVVWDI